MSRLTKEELLNFPKTTYGRALGKTITSKIMNELLQYKILEEQLGCPLEVRCAVVPDSYIYTFGTTVESQDVVTQRHIVTISKEGFTILYATETGKERKMELSWKAYKKTWWLKENREE